MMSTRRSFFIFGALLAAVVLLAPAAALAQTSPAINSADPATWDKLRVTWTADTTAASDEGYRIYYRAQSTDTADEPASAANNDGYKDVDGQDDEEVTLTGLKHSTTYRAAVAPMGEAAGIGTAVPTAGDPGASAKTEAAPPPAAPGGVMAEGGDETFMVMWNAPYPGGSGLSIDHYRVQKREVAGSLFGEWVPDEDDDDNDKMGGLKVAGDMTMVTFEDLENGVTYQARVMAMNSADVPGEWSIPDGHMPAVGPESATVGDDDEEEMMETPALPLVGILLLGAGLVAAGRRRLRQ